MKSDIFPGFVDLQVNGFQGVDFSSARLTEKEFTHACRELLKRGTAGFLPTLISSPMSVYERNLPLIAGMMKEKEFAGRILGIHLEGPFISREPGAVGAHKPDYVLKPDLATLNHLVELAGGAIRLVTVAAELDGVDKLIRFATNRRMAVSIGHSMAGEADLDRAVREGAVALTHLGNGVPNMLPRYSNPIWAGLANDSLAAMIIADGHHLPPSVIKTMIRTKGVEKTIVVSDASPAAGMPPGCYNVLGNEAVLEQSGRLYNPAKQCLVGSSATMLECMNHLASLRLLSFEELVVVGTLNPLRLIKSDVPDVDPISPLAYDDAIQSFIRS